MLYDSILYDLWDNVIVYIDKHVFCQRVEISTEIDRTPFTTNFINIGISFNELKKTQTYWFINKLLIHESCCVFNNPNVSNKLNNNVDITLRYSGSLDIK